MHELRLLRDLMEDILRHAESVKAKKITKVYVRLGELAEINPEILAHFFRENSKGTVMEDAEVVIKSSLQREIVLESFDYE